MTEIIFFLVVVPLVLLLWGMVAVLGIHFYEEFFK